MTGTNDAAGDKTPRYESTEVEDAEVLRYRKPGRFWITGTFEAGDAAQR